MDSTLACLAGWMPRQRWYVGKGRPPALRMVADIAWTTDEGVRVRTLLVADEATAPAVLYQVPVVERPATDADHPEHAIGSPAPGLTLIDGPRDPAYTAALLDLVTGSRPEPAPELSSHPVSPISLADAEAHVLAGEQSNTSIVFRPADGSPAVICKVFRAVHPGVHPDVEVQSALSRAGSPSIAPVVGWVEGRWGEGHSGALAFAQQFVEGGRDGWRLALGSASNAEDFSGLAVDLARATASIHRDMAEAFGTSPTAAEDQASLAAAWRARLAMAIAEVPALAPLREAIEAVYDRAQAIPWPDRQRIHGDFHLGQTLHVDGGGWVVLDFEGEPLRPMAERTAPDLALRDVAGMLRSLDYVAGSLGLEQPGPAADEAALWASRTRAAFLDAYAEASGHQLASLQPLLDALELDKAVYEVIYEARSRPTWIPIPLGAVQRLAGAPAGTA